MTIGKLLMRRGAIPGGAPAAILAALLLAGCSSGHVGEDWQCPLATGGSCDSVAMADPAVPKPAKRSAPGQPIRLLPLEASPNGADTPPDRGPGQASMETPPCATDCGFDPFAWLERLFEGEGEEETGSARTAAAQPSFPSRDVEERPAEPPTASLPDEPDTDTGEPASGPGNPEAGDLRTDETVARIWIAPFVDADGIYREAAHVRVVLEPAGWRLR